MLIGWPIGVRKAVSGCARSSFWGDSIPYITVAPASLPGPLFEDEALGLSKTIS